MTKNTRREYITKTCNSTSCVKGHLCPNFTSTMKNNSVSFVNCNFWKILKNKG